MHQLSDSSLRIEFNRITVPLLIFLLSVNVISLSAQTPSDTLVTEKIIQLDLESAHWGPLHYKTVERPKIGLALSGGGLRGLAQIGIIDEFEKAGIPIDFIAGSSIGSIVGGLYAIGYSPSELEEFALNTNWAEIFFDSPERSSLFVSQKSELNRHIFEVRFEGITPYIPQAVSQGQRVSALLQSHILSATFNSYRNFDDFKIPLRVTATDFIHGTQRIFDSGDLSLAIMASISVPLLFSPVRIDSILYVDAGLLNNIPTDVVRGMGSDIVVAANTTSPMRDISQMKLPWEHFDQGITIMQQLRNKELLRDADVVISPNLEEFQSYDASAIPEYIKRGREEAQSMIPEVQRKLEQSHNAEENDLSHQREEALYFIPDRIDITGNSTIPRTYFLEKIHTSTGNASSLALLRKDLLAIFDTGFFSDVSARIINQNDTWAVEFRLTENPVIEEITITGNVLFDDGELQGLYPENDIPVFNSIHARQFIQSVTEKYSGSGYSLAQITNFTVDTLDKSLNISIHEGRIENIRLIGNVKTKSHVILREFPLKPGDVFESNKFQRGIENIYGSGLFQRVHPSFADENGKLILFINLEEKKSEAVRMGGRYDLEQQSKGFVEFVDDNFSGTGLKSLLHLRYGARDEQYFYRLRADRIFLSYLTFDGDLHYSARSDFMTSPDRDFNKQGNFKDTRIGLRFSLGRQLGRFGTVTAELNIEKVKIEAFPEGAYSLTDKTDILRRANERLDLRRFTIRSVADTRDQYPFPSRGYYHELYYETSGKIFSGDLSYIKFYSTASTIFTLRRRNTFETRFVFGFADDTLPYSQRFRWGGLHSFYGTQLNSMHGRMIAATNLEYRYRLPSQSLFNIYFGIRYDLANVAQENQAVKFRDFRQAFGGAISFDLPFGPIELGYGISFNDTDRIYFSLGHHF
ncbi:patatin-like phospholipase family protein [candidate division KSB1 bacterium]